MYDKRMQQFYPDEENNKDIEYLVTKSTQYVVPASSPEEAIEQAIYNADMFELRNSTEYDVETY